MTPLESTIRDIALSPIRQISEQRQPENRISREAGHAGKILQPADPDVRGRLPGCAPDLGIELALMMEAQARGMSV